MQLCQLNESFVCLRGNEWEREIERFSFFFLNRVNVCISEVKCELKHKILQSKLNQKWLLCVVLCYKWRKLLILHIKIFLNHGLFCTLWYHEKRNSCKSYFVVENFPRKIDSKHRERNGKQQEIVSFEWIWWLFHFHRYKFLYFDCYQLSSHCFVFVGRQTRKIVFFFSVFVDVNTFNLIPNNKKMRKKKFNFFIIKKKRRQRKQRKKEINGNERQRKWYFFMFIRCLIFSANIFMHENLSKRIITLPFSSSVGERGEDR